MQEFLKGQEEGHREILTRIGSETEEKGTCDGNVDRERLNFYFDYELGL